MGMNSKRSLNSEENDSKKKTSSFQKRKSIDLRVLKLNSEDQKPIKTMESLSDNSDNCISMDKIDKA